MGHWQSEISSNMTFAYCTKGCIDVAELRGRPLTHVDAKPKFIYRTFPFFFLRENSQRGCIKGKNVKFFKGRYTQSMMEASIARKRTHLGRRVLRQQLAQVCASSCIMTCFSCAAMVQAFNTQSVLVHFLPKMGLRKSRYLKFRRARPQCVVLHTLVLMYSWWDTCTHWHTALDSTTEQAAVYLCIVRLQRSILSFCLNI